MKRKTLLLILIIVVISFFTYRYIYKDHRNISTETATYVISIPELQQEFTTNDSLAFIKYQDKTIKITALVTALETENNALILDNKLYAVFNDSLTKDIIIGKKISIKGRFLGYDELLEEFKMDQCLIIR